MSTADPELEEIDRIHDDEPEQAAARLRVLDVSQLSADKLPRLGFLLNHVLGEKFGHWQEALARLAALAQRTDAPPAVARHWAVAARLADDRAAQARALARLSESSGARPDLCAALAEVAALNFVADPVAHCTAFDRTARMATGFEASSLDAGFGAAFNNVTSALLAASLGQPMTAAMRAALVNGAEAARVFWYRAGQWMEHERADYLSAKVGVRVGDHGAAQTAARRGLALVAANGNDPIERGFLLQPLAAACALSCNAEEAQSLRAEADALAAGFDAAYRKYYDEDTRELFGSEKNDGICFIGGGNMAAALIGGLIRAGAKGTDIRVVEVDAARREQLHREFGVNALAAPDASIACVDTLVLAVKPQQMKDVCAALRPFVARQLIVSVAAGIRAADLARWLGTECIVRTMPNTPALVGKGITGMAALAGVSATQRQQAENILRTAGSVVWVDSDAQIDAATALSGSGPAYVFYVIEALIDAGRDMGFTAEQARRLAIETCVGAAHLAATSTDPPEELRARVTSKGGTTAAALASLEADKVKASFVRAVRAAQRRAAELGDEFGRD